MTPVQPIRRTRAMMDQQLLELVLERSDSGSSAIHHVIETRSAMIALSTAVPAGLTFGPSHSHRVWRMMNALIDAVPEWADVKAFERDREKMLRFGLSKAITLERLYALSDAVLGLWTAAEAKDAAD